MLCTGYAQNSLDGVVGTEVKGVGGLIRRGAAHGKGLNCGGPCSTLEQMSRQLEQGDNMSMGGGRSIGVRGHAHAPVHIERLQVEHDNAVLDLIGDLRYQHHGMLKELVQPLVSF